MIATMAVLAALKSRNKNTNAHDPAEGLSEPNPESSGAKLFAHESEHVFMAFDQERGNLDIASSDQGSFPKPREEKAWPNREALWWPKTTSIATGVMALSDSRPTLGLAGVDPRSSFITPVRLAIASTPERARMTPTNWTHIVPRLSCRGSKKCVVNAAR